MHNRRAFLAGIGGAVGASTAGCLGSSSNDDGGTLRLVMAPQEYQGIVMDHVTGENGALNEKLDEAGYELQTDESWDDVALFAAEGPDVGSMAPIEAAQLGAQRDQQLAVVGRASTNWVGWWTTPDSEYHPERTGGVDATIEKVAADGATVGIGGWGGGDVPAYSLIASMNDLTFGENDGDFEVVTADYFALGDLLKQGEIDVASTGPMLGIVDPIRNDEMDDVFYISDYLVDRDEPIPSLTTWVVPQDYLEEHRPAVEALVEAYQEGVDWLYDNAYDAVTQEKYMEMLAVESEANAEWLADWGLKTTESMDTPVVWEQTTLTEDYAGRQEEFLNRTADLGVAPSDWDDHLEFEVL